MSDKEGFPLTPADVDQIVAALDGSAFEKMVLETPRFSLKIARTGAGGWSQEWHHADTISMVAAVAQPEKISAPIAEGLVAIHSPLPGSFYRAPQPGAPAFVQVGDVVGPDSVIAIIETMKVMNSVPAGVAGEIVAILATDGDMVDPGTQLMHLRPITS